jgi:maltose alpha-D-glucosyltransferase / alpha-amylase
MHDVPSFRLRGSLDATALRAVMPELARAALPSFLLTRRWFGDKSRTISSVELITSPIIVRPASLLALAIVSVSFAEDGAVDYFVPLAVLPTPEPGASTLAEIDAEVTRWAVVDAVESSDAQRWFLEALERSDASLEQQGFRWTRTAALDRVLPSATSLEPRLSAAQQSNSSIVYGNTIIMKAFRRLSPGRNPEVEIGRFLTTATRFRNTPQLLGELSYGRDGREPISLAVAQDFVPSVADGWTYLLDLLRSPKSVGDEVPVRLGQLTAQMHLALASAPQDSELAPQPILPADAVAWTSQLRDSIDATSRALAARRQTAPIDIQDLVDAFLRIAPTLREHATGFERLIGRAKTRVHGDFHLGQTLRTPDGDFVILDFEGEPQRSIAERRAKTSPLKDVAGMLRSFGYARGTAERQLAADASSHESRSALIAWERRARKVYVESYISECHRNQAPFLPTSDDDVRQALAAWELDKALYEVNYEMNNRPDWLSIPLSAVLKFG